MAIVNVRGINHYYEWICHSGERTSKPVMVFVHGWGGSAKYWRSTAEALTGDFDCLLYDMRGFGRSAVGEIPENTGYTMVEYADDLAALLDILNVDKVSVHAHSMGSSVATFFINRYKEKVQQAILACNGIFEYNKIAFAVFHKIGGYVVKLRYNWFLKVPQADRMFMARFLHRPISKRDRVTFLEDFLLADYTAAAGTIYTSVSKEAVEIMPKEFASISVPTLMVSGEKDIIIPAIMGKQASALNDNLQYAEIAQTGHFPMLEDKASYLKIVKDFLQVPAVTS